MLLRYLGASGGETELAKRFGASRRTVCNWIKNGQLDWYPNAHAIRLQPLRAIPRKLDPYRGIIARGWPIPAATANSVITYV